jgi:hypothetical protein
LAASLIIFVRGLVAVVDNKNAGKRSSWGLVLVISFVHLIACGGPLSVLQVLWGKQLPP